MGEYRQQSHTTYKCEYHPEVSGWTPKYRFRVLKDEIASELRHDIYPDASGLSSMKEVLIEELNI